MNQSTLLLFFLLGLFSCETTGPPPPPAEPQIQLQALDVSCTEAWLEIKLPLGIQPRSITLLRDTNLVLSTTLVATETTIVDEGLLPNRSYAYTAMRPTGSSNEQVTASLVTLDTTSHDFIWQTDTLGDASSVLYDIAIVNDTLAYAVGAIYLRDSTGQLDPIAYSVAIWNGSSWALKRLSYATNNLIAPIRGILVSGPNDIWLAAGSIFHWNGVSSQAPLMFSRLSLPDPNATIESLWGSNNGDIFGVGNAGTIVYYNGNNWQRLESGTTLPIQDIWGSENSNGGRTILCIASHVFQNQGSRVLSIEGTSVEELSNIGLSWPIVGMWFVPERRHYAVGSGVHTKRFLTDSAWFQHPPGEITSFGSGAIRGSDLNNVFVVGSFHEVVHFNGVSWKSYFPAESSGVFGDISMHGNAVMIVGQVAGSRGLVLRGYRQ